MLSPYGKTNPPDYALSFCDSSNTPHSYHWTPSLPEPSLAPAACGHRVRLAPCLPGLVAL